MASSPTTEQLRDDWLQRLSALIQEVQRWAEESGWTTKRIEITLTDSQLGKYRAPALLMQDEGVRVLLEPIARTAPGAEGVVDLYLMPAYDDIASLYLDASGWHLHYVYPGIPTMGTLREAEAKALSSDSLREVLEAMKENALQ